MCGWFVIQLVWRTGGGGLQLFGGKVVLVSDCTVGLTGGCVCMRVWCENVCVCVCVYLCV